MPLIAGYNVVCDVSEFEKYLLVPSNDHNFTIEAFSEAICHLNSTHSIDLMGLVIEETNFEDLIKAVSISNARKKSELFSFSISSAVCSVYGQDFCQWQPDIRSWINLS